MLQLRMSVCLSLSHMSFTTARPMKIYINHPQTICIHPVKLRLEIPSRPVGVWKKKLFSILVYSLIYTDIFAFKFL